jgi:hypothetical protein
MHEAAEFSLGTHTAAEGLDGVVVEGRLVQKGAGLSGFALEGQLVVSS